MTVLTKAEPGESNTGYAQGGVAAAVGPDDSADLHARDTIGAGDGLCDPDAVRVLVSDGPRYVNELLAWGAAFDRDAGETATLVARLADGRTVEQSLTISPRAWDIERVDIPRTQGRTTEEFWRIREPDLARIAAARSKDHDVDGWRQPFTWPVRGRISGRFGSQRIYRGGEAGSYHSGLDIATGESGTPYVAPADGVVVLAAESPLSLEGLLLIIDHGGGLNSAFLHSSRLVVREGDLVRRGQHIGDIGATGRATGPHLHWSLKWREARLDPLLFVGAMD